MTDMTTQVCITALSGMQAFPTLLRQALGLTLEMPDQNRRLLCDDLTSSAEVRAFQMAFCTLDAIRFMA